MLKKIIVIAGAALFSLGLAYAGEQKPLTEDMAKRFVETLPALDALSAQMEEEGVTEELQLETSPKAGEEFKPYSKSVVALKEKHPGHHARLADAVKPHGFTTEEWGNVGDRVILAYLAIQMEEENPGAMEQMKAMDPQMLEMMPPAAKEQFAAAMAMMETVEKASPEDKEVVKKIKPELDEYMDGQGKSDS